MSNDRVNQWYSNPKDYISRAKHRARLALTDPSIKLTTLERSFYNVIFKYNKTRITKKTQLSDFYKVGPKGLTSLEDGAMTLTFDDENQKPEKLAAMMIACLASKQRIHVPVCQSCIEEQAQ